MHSRQQPASIRQVYTPCQCMRGERAEHILCANSGSAPPPLDQCSCGTYRAGLRWPGAAAAVARLLAENKDWWGVDKGRKWEIRWEMRNGWRQLLTQLVKSQRSESSLFPQIVFGQEIDGWAAPEEQVSTGRGGKTGVDCATATRSFFVREHVRWTIVHKLLHILGQTRRIPVNALIQALVNGILSHLRSWDCQVSTKKIAKTHRKQALMCSGGKKPHSDNNSHHNAPPNESSNC